MRLRRILLVLGIMGIVSIPFLVLRAQESRRPLRSALGEERYSKSGLDKLSPAEESELLNLIYVGPSYSYTESSASLYMKKEGWREVRIVGAIPTDDAFDEHWLLVWDNYRLYTLDPFSTSQLPAPGIYWAKNTLSSWTLLYPDASEVSFSAKDME